MSGLGFFENDRWADWEMFIADTMAPVGAESGTADVAAGLGDEPAPAAAAGPGAKKGSYVPPALRAGAAGAAAGDRMGGSKYGERDDLATLRVTNVSFLPPLPHPFLRLFVLFL